MPLQKWFASVSLRRVKKGKQFPREQTEGFSIFVRCQGFMLQFKGPLIKCNHCALRSLRAPLSAEWSNSSANRIHVIVSDRVAGNVNKKTEKLSFCCCT